MSKSKISWTEKTWNPTTGCSKVSKGCKNCYAERQWPRLAAMHKDYAGRDFTDVKFHEDRVTSPMAWKRVSLVFLNSMSDLFHEDIPFDAVDKVMSTVWRTNHKYQLLTKRPERALEYFLDKNREGKISAAADSVDVDLDMLGKKEEWRSIPGYREYSVSSFGRVRRNESGLVLSELKHRGYRSVALSSEGIPKHHLIHRLVLEAFRGPAGDGEESCHINGNRSDNRTANLRWGTRKENMSDASRHGTVGAWMKSMATLTKEQVRQIRSMRKNGALLDEIAEKFGGTRQQMSAICLGKIFKEGPLSLPLHNLWFGVSVENQESTDRVNCLIEIPAAVRFLSIEPLLGPIDIPHLDKLDWIICGDESGPKRRPAELDWVRGIRDQCTDADVPFFFKQWHVDGKKTEMPELDGEVWGQYPKGVNK